MCLLFLCVFENPSPKLQLNLQHRLGFCESPIPGCSTKLDSSLGFPRTVVKNLQAVLTRDPICCIYTSTHSVSLCLSGITKTRC